jgi:glycosyltransferase involved in cell wall biosynthesis
MAPLISIIVPVYNAEKTICRCIGSIQNQTFIDWELLLIDDGSTDQSVNICDKYALKDRKIKTIHKENGGVSSARNKGIECSNGDYILMLDSDDSLEFNTCESLMAMTEEKNTDCIVFGFKQSSGSIWTAREDKDYNSVLDFKKDFSYWLSTELLSSSVNKLYKKSLIRDLYPENISFGEDLIFCLSYLKQCHSISFITDTFYLHNNLNINSICHTFSKNRIFEIELWQTAVLDYIGNDFDKKLYRKYLKDILFYVKGLYGCESISYSEKKNILNKWSESSYFFKKNMPLPSNIVDDFIFFCLKNKMWYLPYLMMEFKHVFTK